MGFTRLTGFLKVSSTPFLVYFLIYLHFNLLASIFFTTRMVAYFFTQKLEILFLFIHNQNNLYLLYNLKNMGDNIYKTSR